jgi:hypothetical protein
LKHRFHHPKEDQLLSIGANSQNRRLTTLDSQIDTYRAVAVNTMGYWFRISFSPLDLVKKKHLEFQNELLDCYSAPGDEILLVRRADNSEYFFHSDQSIPMCLQSLLNNWAKRSDPPAGAVDYVFGDETTYRELSA